MYTQTYVGTLFKSRVNCVIQTIPQHTKVIFLILLGIYLLLVTRLFLSFVCFLLPFLFIFIFLIMNNRNDKKRKHCGGAEKIRALNKKKLALDSEKCLKINNMFKPVCETMPDETVSIIYVVNIL